ncbi:MAG: RNase adapter RapZ [Chloroflexota bacterium]
MPLAFGAMRGALEGRGIRPVIFFLEASDDVLIRRFSETRHRHPLADERGIAASIELEREMLESVRMQADVVIDTSHSSLRELRERIFARLGDVQNSDQLGIQLISFGFKYGVPLEADLVLDVRFMKNPHYIEGLRHQNGLTDPVREYVMALPIAEQFLARLRELLDLLVPAYVDEGKTRLTIAIGCTGGFHRSVVMTEELAAWLRERDFGPVSVFHRELER